MRFTLAKGDLEDFQSSFRTGSLLASTVDDPERMRFWHVLDRSEERLIIQHGTGAVAVLEIFQGRIASLRLHQGDSAEPLLRSHGFRVPGETRKLVGSKLKPGIDAGRALESMKFLTRLPDLSAETIRFRLSWGGVLLVDVDARGRVLSHRWLEGGDALDVLLEGEGGGV